MHLLEQVAWMSPRSEVPPTASLVVLTLRRCLFKCNVRTVTSPSWPNTMPHQHASSTAAVGTRPDEGASGAVESSSTCQGADVQSPGQLGAERPRSWL